VKLRARRAPLWASLVLAAASGCVPDAPTLQTAVADTGAGGGAGAGSGAGTGGVSGVDSGDAEGGDACSRETDDDFCTRLAKNCGSVTAYDNCGASRNVASCGTCTFPQTCRGNNVCACIAETDAEFCSRLASNCDTVTASDNCGNDRTVTSCGACSGTGMTCGGGGTANVCGCTPETDAAFCARLGKNCGSVTAADSCGASRTAVRCGSCVPPQVCDGGNVCCTPEADATFCARLGKNCGSVTANDNCGLRTVGSCGTCGGTASECYSGLCMAPISSCNGLAETCGPNGNESCCASIVVSGGTFLQGRSTVPGASDYSTATCPGSEFPEYLSTVSRFALDKYEVTVGRFRKFVEAYVNNTATVPADGAGANPNVSGSGWRDPWNAYLPPTQAAFKDTSHLKCTSTYQMWTDAAGANENKPINCVSWYEAFAFCIWDGGRLATESEWEYAAAGGADNRLYPWGAMAPDCTYANFYYANVRCGPGGTESLAPVGSYAVGNGKWGHADLAGNAWEWTLDWLGTYPASSATDYANISNGEYRVLRGGTFGMTVSDPRAACRDFFFPGGHDYRFGIRCARSAP
jgi:formylglycine-generating enzyme